MYSFINEDSPFPSVVALLIELEAIFVKPKTLRSLKIFSGRIRLRISSKRRSHILGRDVLENSRQPFMIERKTDSI